MDLDFDALVEASHSGVNKTGEQALWKAAMSLSEWYFVARNAGDDPEPLIGAVEGAPHLIAFTDEQRAQEFASRRPASKVAADAPILCMDVPDAVDYCKQLMETQVEGLLFNSGKYAFQAGLSRIVDMWGRYNPSR